MNQYKFILIFLIGSLAITGCQKMFEPDPDNHQSKERLLKDPAFAEGMLLTAYASVQNPDLTSVATDDAVSNVQGNSFSRMATGEWSSRYSPVSNWNSAYNQLYYLNYFLSFVNDVEWSYRSPVQNELFRTKHTAEARGLRGISYLNLLQAHAGVATDGSLMGVPIVTEPLDPKGNWQQIKRNTFSECVTAINNDFDEALKVLPDEYENTGDRENYDIAFGAEFKNRLNGKTIKAYKARLALLAASPAYNLNNDISLWENAAVLSGSFLSESGGLSNLTTTGGVFYKSSADKDIIWRNDFYQSNEPEKANFPPSLYGRGEINPTQNLVDAFPSKNGYPINSSQSGYDALKPYDNRDPRLAKYIIFNGGDYNKRKVFTDANDVKDGVGRTSASTRTGYYLKKGLLENLNVNPTFDNKGEHFNVFIRYTEIFLNYAEAANEAWGPDGDPRGYGFTARSVINAIRNRAGITQPDNYLASLNSKEEMRDVVRNERRLELCFEGFRFWDIRRWKSSASQLSETAKGVIINGGTFLIFDVEARKYDGHMIYGPIPEKEVLLIDGLLQNQGW